MKNINQWLPYVLFFLYVVADKISSLYDFAKVNDPELANKIKHTATLAKWLVANQDRYADKEGKQKFTDAWKELQASTGVSETVAKGAIQYAVDERHQEPEIIVPAEVKSEDVVPTPEPELEIPKVVVTESTQEKQETLPTVEPVEDKILDDLG